MGSIGSIFDNNSGCRELITNCIRGCPVFFCAGSTTLLDQFADQSVEGALVRIHYLAATPLVARRIQAELSLIHI